eukprot:534999-Ditylum_brightwellii.AAC.1
MSQRSEKEAVLFLCIEMFLNDRSLLQYIISAAKNLCGELSCQQQGRDAEGEEEALCCKIVNK